MNMLGFYSYHLPLLIRLMLAATLLTSALSKLRHPRAFITAVQAYALLSKAWVRPFARTLPWLELVLGLMLLMGWHTRLAALISATLFLLFASAMGINLARGRKDLDCGCSGKPHFQTIGWKTIARNLVLILFSLPLATWGGGFLAFDTQSPAIQTFVIETLLLHTLFPLTLSVGGLFLFSRLLFQTLRLVMLTSVEVQPSAAAENSRSFQPAERQE